MIMTLIKLVALSTMILLMGCNEASIKSPKEIAMTENNQPPAKTPSAEEKWQSATITYMDFEGGFFGLITDDGEKLLPMNLDVQYRQEGAIVKIQGHTINDMMTIQQWGTPFKITKIELIKAGIIIKTNNPTM